MPTPSPYYSASLQASGAKAQTFPVEGATTVAETVTLGTLFVSGIVLTSDQQIDSILVENIAAVTTPSHTWGCLLQAIQMGGLLVMTVLAVTPDALAAAIGPGLIELNFPNPPYITPGDGGFYYAGFCSAGATAGTFLGVTGVAGGQGGFTPGLYGTAGTGLTVPPAVGTQTAAFLAGTVNLWMALA